MFKFRAMRAFARVIASAGAFAGLCEIRRFASPRRSYTSSHTEKTLTMFCYAVKLHGGQAIPRGRGRINDAERDVFWRVDLLGRDGGGADADRGSDGAGSEGISRWRCDRNCRCESDV